VLYFEFGCLVALGKEYSSSIFRIEYSDSVTYFRVKMQSICSSRMFEVRSVTTWHYNQEVIHGSLCKI